MDLVEATLKKPAFGTLRIYEDCEALARAAAELICETAVLKPGPARIALCSEQRRSRPTSCLRKIPCSTASPGAGCIGSSGMSASCRLPTLRATTAWCAMPS